MWHAVLVGCYHGQKNMLNCYIWERIASGWECVDSNVLEIGPSVSGRPKSDDKIEDPSRAAENCRTSTSCIIHCWYQRSNKTTRELQSKRSAQRRHYKHHEFQGLHHIMYPIDQFWISKPFCSLNFTHLLNQLNEKKQSPFHLSPPHHQESHASKLTSSLYQAAAAGNGVAFFQAIRSSRVSEDSILTSVGEFCVLQISENPSSCHVWRVIFL